MIRKNHGVTKLAQEIDQKGLNNLIVWQKSMSFAVKICKTILPILPEQEKWPLTDQLRRSSQSIPANIAEGYGRFYFQEGIRYAYIARGSLEETLSHLSFAKEMGYLSSTDLESLSSDISEIRRMISGYINYLKNSKRGINEPGSQYMTFSGEIENDLN